jgi:hypothetical protein
VVTVTVFVTVSVAVSVCVVVEVFVSSGTIALLLAACSGDGFVPQPKTTANIPNTNSALSFFMTSPRNPGRLFVCQPSSRGI